MQSSVPMFQVVNTNLRFTYDLGADDNVIVLPNVNVSDGIWHTAKVGRYGTQVILQVDHGEGTHYGEAQPFDSHRLQDVGNADSMFADMFGGATVQYDRTGQPAVDMALVSSKNLS